MQYSQVAALLGISWSVAASHQATTANSFGYSFGDQSILSIGASRPVRGRLSASVQAKMFHQQRSRFLGMQLLSTGATFVYLTPGLSVHIVGGASIYGYLQLLPYRYVNEAQLAPRAAVLAGLSKAF